MTFEVVPVVRTRRGNQEELHRATDGDGTEGLPVGHQEAQGQQPEGTPGMRLGCRCIQAPAGRLIARYRAGISSPAVLPVHRTEERGCLARAQGLLSLHRTGNQPSSMPGANALPATGDVWPGAPSGRPHARCLADRRHPADACETPPVEGALHGRHAPRPLRSGRLRRCREARRGWTPDRPCRPRTGRPSERSPRS